MKRSLCALFTAAALLGCVEEDVNLGNSAQIGASLSDYTGVWSGYAEAFEFDDGTDTVQLVLDDNGNGWLRVGDADDLPPPTPGAAYPPGKARSFSPYDIMVSGFDYPVTGALVEARRLRLGTASQELYRDWCELPEPVLSDPDRGIYSCLPNGGFGGNGRECHYYPLDGDPFEVECGYLDCLSLCDCDETSCWVHAPTDRDGRLLRDVQLDAALEDAGAVLTGTFRIGDERVTVRMARQ